MIIYRPTQVSDIPSLQAINRQCLPEHYSDEIWEDIIQYFTLSNYVCCVDDRIVGYLMGCRNYFENKPEMVLVSLAVLPEYRHQGIGAKLIRLFLIPIENQRVVLQVRKSNPAIRLYNRMGFEDEATLTGYYEDGEDAITMVIDGL